VTGGNQRLGMILKGYPRISESFISTEILLLESLGIPIDIYSLRQPRETFSHEHIKQIKAPTTYLPEYVLPHWQALLMSNLALRKLLGTHYTKCLTGAVQRAWERKKAATLRHFLQAGHLAATCLMHNSVTHLHAHFCHTPTSVAFFASELTGLPFSFTAHAKDIYISEPEQLARKIKKARFVVTCTGYNARYLKDVAESAGCHTPLYVIYHGIDLSLFSFAPAPIPGPPYRILSIGRLVAKKGYDTLLKSLKLLDLAGLDFQFTHIGSGEMKPQITRMIRDLDLKQRVNLLGTLPHKEVLNHYRQAHCFALASKVAPNGDRDGIPNVLIEAMATGVPVVATKVSAIPELVEDGVTGVMVQPDDPRGLADAITNLLLHPERFEAHVARARTRVEKDFNNQNCVQRLHSLFRDALQEP
jgi:glycosyltransferase involved in cell wall biosynthesis